MAIYELDGSLQSLHDEAVAKGDPMYLDPQLGLWVQTSETLAKNEHCCGRSCRHCPFDRGEQERAGRSLLRPGP
jgi:hypothetical protein